MKAIVYLRYGGPEVLEYSEVEQPVPGRREVLVRVRASSVNAADYRTMQAEVTAVCGASGVELVSSLGADRVIDYRKQDFTQEGTRYDVVLGVNGYHSLSEYRECLNPRGRYVMIGGTNRQIFESLLFGRVSFMFSDKAASVLTIDHSLFATDLLQLRELLSDGGIRPVIDRSFALEEVADAIRYVEEGHVRGKVVITIDELLHDNNRG